MIGKNYNETHTNLMKAEKSERIKFLIENKKDLIQQKRNVIKEGLPFNVSLKGKGTNKAQNDIPDILTVKLVANVNYYLDSHLDVHVDGNWTKTIQENKGVYHTQDHSQKTSDKVGVIKSLTAEPLKLRDLGINEKREVEGLVVTSEVYKALNEKIHLQYALGMVNQHSVGMQYVKLELAVNDSEDENYTNWEKHIDKIINREVAEENGFFWVVEETKLIEVSAVTRGSNDLTPTLEVKANEPTEVTQTNTKTVADAKSLHKLLTDFKL